MKRINDILILIIGVLLFLTSYVFDQQVSLFFKNIRFTFFDAFLGIVTNFGIVILLMLLVPSFIFYNKNKKLVYLLFLTFIVSFILAFVIKLIVLRQRPTESFTFPFVNIIDYSFPSMHSMVAFSLLPILIKYAPKHKYFWLVFAFLVSFSRLYFRFHFLSDVLFGALFGYLIGIYMIDLYENGKLWKK